MMSWAFTWAPMALEPFFFEKSGDVDRSGDVSLYRYASRLACFSGGRTKPARTVPYDTITGTDQSKCPLAGNADASSYSSFPAESARYHAFLPHTRNFTLIADLTG